MFPIQDSTPRKTVPYMNYLLIIINIIVFALEITAPDFETFVRTYAFTPSNFNFYDLGSYVTVFTSLFLHGGILHIASNMWFLHIFGDNIEDRFGHLQFLLFYLGAGVAATLSQYLLTASSDIPSIGASGAISGIIGAYFVFFRKSTIETLVIFFIVEIPSWFFIGYWIFLQVFSGIGSIINNTLQFGGVAWFAHIGGFVFGLIIGSIIYFINKKPKSPIKT
jgi:membrane associated rhomboid family serine protease